MDELAKAMKVIRLRDELYGQYLTADEDQVSVTLTKPNTEGYNPKNTEWRLQWLKSPKGLVGQVRLWSIYNKALTFTEDPASYYYNGWSDALTQAPWPPSQGGETASEWQLELLKRKNNNVALAGFLCKWSKTFNEHLGLDAGQPKSNKSRFMFNSISRNVIFRWANWKWYIEVVVENNNDSDNITTTSSVSQKTSTPVPEQPLIHGNHGANNNDYEYLPDQFMSTTFSRWQVGQVYLNISQNATGGNMGRGYKYGQYGNSGGNVNGSGVQNNGDVSLYSEINRSRDNNASFVNYKYE